jgi:hypothetical protein
MQKQQALHCNEVVAGATRLCKGSRRYTIMQKKQELHCKAEVAGAAL